MSVFTSTKSGEPQKPQLVSEPRFAPGPPEYDHVVWYNSIYIIFSSYIQISIISIIIIIIIIISMLSLLPWSLETTHENLVLSLKIVFNMFLKAVNFVCVSYL
jgi:hypothetical protein